MKDTATRAGAEMTDEVRQELESCLEVVEVVDVVMDEVLPTLREELDEILGEIAVDAGDRGRMRWLSAIQTARVLLKEPPQVFQQPPQMKTGFTVILMYPDYMQSGGSRPETYAMYSTAKTQGEAVAEARGQVTQENDMTPEEGEDFAVVAIFKGDTDWDVQDDD